MFSFFDITSFNTSYFPDIEHFTANSSTSAYTATNTHATGTSTISPEFIEINRGAAKIVWVKRSSIPSTMGTREEDNKVYYTAVDSVTRAKEQELKQEFGKMQSIKQRLSSQPKSLMHLFVEAEEQPETNRIHQNFTLKVDRASCNFEKKLCHSQTSLAERIILGSHLLNGLANLHTADFVHGDIKPENCLIFEQEGQNILKLSDFGKAEEMPDKKTGLYSGNTRFAPLEGKLSKKGDVYGAALILIRNFEEACLINEKKTSLLEVNKNDFDIAASDELRGIEKYVVEHKAFLACNEKWNLDEFRRRIQMNIRSEDDKQEQTTALYNYIDVLQEKLEGYHYLSSTQAQALCSLLKQMTHPDSNQRLSAAEAEKLYQTIFYNEFHFRKSSLGLRRSE